MSNKGSDDSTLSCADFFRKRHGYQRAFGVMYKKWKQYGRTAGVIKIENPSQEEQETLEMFFGKEFSKEIIRFTMAEFEGALKETRFGTVTMGELLAEYFKEELITNKEQKNRENQRKEQFFQELCETAANTFGKESGSYLWLSCIANQKKFGYYLILKEYMKEPENGKWQVESVCRALESLKNRQEIRLAVLGAEVTGNPHEYDRNTVVGKLLIQALSCIHGNMKCKSAEDILMLYYAAGIKPDDISSFTTVYGIHFYTDEGEHLAYQNFIEKGEPFVVTLFNLGRIQRADAKNKKVFAIENQMVFSHLCEGLEGKEVALICTSGQVKTASLILLDMLREAGCRIFYSGDFDPEGIEIAERLVTRYPECVRPWYMMKADYDLAISDKDISKGRLNKLKKIKSSCLLEVKTAILDQKKAGYQEKLLEKMLNCMLEV